ncbi:MAG: hypothetical protein IPL59_21270 [Candidatus Competibacteraceae bacterium]|nr:hypothetical protein [Candidatus Competibacteraceae bacterium]
MMAPAADHATEHERDQQIDDDRQQQGAVTRAMTPRLVSASAAAPTSPSTLSVRF